MGPIAINGSGCDQGITRADSISLGLAGQHPPLAGESAATNSVGYDFDRIGLDVGLLDASGAKVGAAVPCGLGDIGEPR